MELLLPERIKQASRRKYSFNESKFEFLVLKLSKVIQLLNPSFQPADLAIARGQWSLVVGIVRTIMIMATVVEAPNLRNSVR